MNERKIYLKYVSVFSLIFIFVYLWIILSGKTLISFWDGLTQHYTALRYIGNYIKDTISGTLNGASIQEFDFDLGVGSDIIHTFSYYGLGDIELLLLAAVCPQKYMEILYCILIYSKMALAGICFLRLTREMKCDEKSSLIASLAYVYCNFALESSWGHYFFLNALIMLPWMICEIEKKISGKKNHFLISILISLCANYYLFYMCALMVALYGIVRILEKTSAQRERILMLLSCIKDVVAAILIGAPFILPTIYGYLNGSRTESNVELKDIFLVAPMEGLERLFETGNGFVEWEAVGVSCIILLAIIALYCGNRKNGKLKIYVLIGGILLVFPFTGFVFNVFSYVSYRYLFCYAFLLCLLFAYTNPLEMKRDIRFLKTSVTLYIVLFFFFCGQITKIEDAILLSPLFCGIVAAICIYRDVRYKYQYILILCGISIVLHAWNVAGADGEIQGHMVPILETDKYAKENELLEFETLQLDEEIYRVSTSNDIVEFENYGIASGQSTMEIYYSIINGSYYNALREMENPELYLPHRIKGFDERIEIAELFSNKYYITEKEQEIPFGYEIVETKNGKILCKNKYWIPIAYYYDSYITKDMIMEQNGLQKASLYLQTAVLENEIEGIDSGGTESSYIRLDNLYITLNGDSVEGNIVVNNNEILRVEFAGVCDAQYCIRLKGYRSSGEEHYVTIISESGEQIYAIKGSDSRYYYDSDAKTFNIGYSADELGWCEILFDSEMEVAIDEIEVWALPTEAYIRATENLQTQAVSNIGIGTDYLEGGVVCDKKGIVCISIPFSKGWNAYVDGEKVDILKVNGSFLGVVIESGNHEIYLEYESPLLREGICLSILTMSIIAVYKIKKRRENGSDDVW